MFEARFKIVALVESDKQGQRVFNVFKQAEPATDEAFSSLVRTLYQQQISRLLQAGDTLTISVQLDLSRQEIEQTVRVREDGSFEGDGLQAPTADLFALIVSLYEPLSQQALGDVFTLTFRLQRF